ncbi:MAG: DUF308 domain-containing protein [Myxococcaceae bacterium]
MAWGITFTLGLLLVALGVFAIAASGTTGLATVFLFGAILAGSGIVQIVNAFANRKEGRFALQLLAGVLSAVIGVLMFMRPVAGLAAVSLLIIGYFFASGLFYSVTSIADRYPRWSWDFAYGLSAIVLGIIGLTQWPITVAWLVGTLIGLEILFRGVNLMSSSLLVRRVSRRALV